MKSTPEMRARIRELMTGDDYDRAVACVLDDLESMMAAPRAIAAIPADFYWLIGKGKTRPDEPLYGCQIMSVDDGKIVAAAEHDDLATAIELALSNILPKGAA